VVAAHDVVGSNELLISTEVSGEPDLTAMRQIIDETLAQIGGRYSVRSFEAIGPQIGADLRKQAVLATASASGGMLAYLAWRFRWIYGVAAVIAVTHDTLITIGLFSLADKELSLTVVAALLTLIGYSMNDTIVIFDRIRENRNRLPREPLTAVVNLSINQTLSRTVLTSGLTLLTALSLLWFGGVVLNGFSFALVAGIVVGTYSSIFIASPILVAWEEWVRGGVRCTVQ
jgi:preprotein translocase subunit SecF